MNAFSLLGRYMSASLRAQMQYPAARFCSRSGSFVATILDMVADLGVVRSLRSR
jgi:hypothetical protein